MMGRDATASLIYWPEKAEVNSRRLTLFWLHTTNEQLRRK